MGFRKNKKKSNAEPVNPALPPAPLPPLPGMPLPAPNAPVIPDLPVPSELPPASLPPLPDTPSQSLLSAANNQSTGQQKPSDDYGDLWAKKSNKPLPQIYGHIDRISSGEAGSLLDRYADRFGHSLDRDIIVLRKQQHDEKIAEIRDAPVVELLEDDNEELSVAEQLSSLENQIRTLKPTYQQAKSDGDATKLAELKPQLESLLKERKLLKSSMSQPEIETHPTAEAQPVVAQEADEEDIFVTFVSIVDELLGSNLPSEVVESFVASDDFNVYQTVGSDPLSADDDLRSLFFAIVDNQLGNMSAESIDKFVASSEFKIYSTVGEMYQ
jgi:hypothetical protein